VAFMLRYFRRTPKWQPTTKMLTRAPNGWGSGNQRLKPRSRWSSLIDSYGESEYISSLTVALHDVLRLGSNMAGHVSNRFI